MYKSAGQLEEAAQCNVRSVVERVALSEPQGLVELYDMIRTHVRACVGRRLGWSDSVNDIIHDVFVTTAECIRHGALNEPNKLRSFVLGVARHLTSREIRLAARRRRSVVVERISVASTTPEQLHQTAEERELAWRVLNWLPNREREILERFYLREQTAEHISKEMGLTETQFRLAKSRAKAHFGVLGRRTVARRRVDSALDIGCGPL